VAAAAGAEEPCLLPGERGPTHKRVQEQDISWLGRTQLATRETFGSWAQAAASRFLRASSWAFDIPNRAFRPSIPVAFLFGVLSSDVVSCMPVLDACELQRYAAQNC
jgi:hypothetical protein